MFTMQKRKTCNHNDKYVIFFEFSDKETEFDPINKSLDEMGLASEEP